MALTWLPVDTAAMVCDIIYSFYLSRKAKGSPSLAMKCISM